MLLHFVRLSVFCTCILLGKITKKNQEKTTVLGVLKMYYVTTREILKDTLAADEEYHRDKWTMFGNELEKVETDVIRNQHVLRTRVDTMTLRKQVKVKIWSQE